MRQLFRTYNACLWCSFKVLPIPAPLTAEVSFIQRTYNSTLLTQTRTEESAAQGMFHTCFSRHYNRLQAVLRHVPWTDLNLWFDWCTLQETVLQNTAQMFWPSWSTEQHFLQFTPLLYFLCSLFLPCGTFLGGSAAYYISLRSVCALGAAIVFIQHF